MNKSQPATLRCSRCSLVRKITSKIAVFSQFLSMIFDTSTAPACLRRNVAERRAPDAGVGRTEIINPGGDGGQLLRHIKI